MLGLRLLASFAACFAPLVLAGFAAAEPVIVSQQYDFRTDDGRSTGGAWTPSHSGNPALANRWRWAGSPGRNNGRWAETPPTRGRGQAQNGNYLTSPVIDVPSLLGSSGDTFRLSIAQRFNFNRNGRGQPVAAGEIAYSLDGGEFIPIPLSAFASGGSIQGASFHGIDSPFATIPGLVNQTAFVAPNASWAGPPPLLAGGGLFTGRSPGFNRGGYVPTEAILDFRGSGISFNTIQFRLIEASLGSRCPPRSRWDVRFMQVDIAAPEPGGLVLAGIGCALLVWRWRRLHITAGGASRRSPHLRRRPPRRSCRHGS